MASLDFTELIYLLRSGFCYNGLIHLCIRLSHLHEPVVRVHSEEILLSERGPGLLMHCEVALIL